MPHRPLRKRCSCFVLACALLSGCASSPSPATGRSKPEGRGAAGVSHLEERALLLLLTDRRLYDPFTVSQVLQGGPELRRRLARALGQVRDPRGRAILQELMGDASAEVRRAAVYACGQLGEELVESSLGSALMLAIIDPDREVGARAIVALADGGMPLERVVERLVMLPASELFPRLLPSLYRFAGPGRLRWAIEGLRGQEGELRRLAAYAVARQPLPEAAPVLRDLLEDEDPWIRAWAVRGLGQVGDGEDLPRLLTLLADGDPRPVLRSLQAARRLVGAGKVAVSEDWVPRLSELMKSTHSGVRMTAYETATAWLPSPSLEDALEAVAVGGSERERQVAFLSLVRGGSVRAMALALDFARSPSVELRAASADAAGQLGLVPLLGRLAEDRSPRVRRSVLSARLEWGSSAARWLGDALEDADAGVRLTALEALVDRPVLPARMIQKALEVARRDRIPEPRLVAIRALAARGSAEPLDRGAVIGALELLARDADDLLRREAGVALERLGRPRPRTGPLKIERSLAAYREIVQQTSAPKLFELRTSQGTMKLRIECPEAPLSCLSFMQLARQGFYDEQVFHLVVPGFIAQTGDPRGDGLGGPGYSLRDEIHPMPFLRGALGLAHSGRDTAGSQFFITLDRQPHLDGRYTLLGRVVEGLDVLTRLMQGDPMVSLVEITTSAP